MTTIQPQRPRTAAKASSPSSSRAAGAAAGPHGDPRARVAAGGVHRRRRGAEALGETTSATAGYRGGVGLQRVCLEVPGRRRRRRARLLRRRRPCGRRDDRHRDADQGVKPLRDRLDRQHGPGAYLACVTGDQNSQRYRPDYLSRRHGHGHGRAGEERQLHGGCDHDRRWRKWLGRCGGPALPAQRRWWSYRWPCSRPGAGARAARAPRPRRRRRVRAAPQPAARAALRSRRSRVASRSTESRPRASPASAAGREAPRVRVAHPGRGRASTARDRTEPQGGEAASSPGT